MCSYSLQLSNFIFNWKDPSPRQITANVNYFLSLCAHLLLLTLEWDHQLSVFLCCHHIAPGFSWRGVRLAAENRRSKRWPPPNLACFPEVEPTRSEPSWCNGNMLVPSESERRKILLIKAASLCLLMQNNQDKKSSRPLGLDFIYKPLLAL